MRSLLLSRLETDEERSAQVDPVGHRTPAQAPDELVGADRRKLVLEVEIGGLHRHLAVLRHLQCLLVGIGLQAGLAVADRPAADPSRWPPE